MEYLRIRNWKKWQSYRSDRGQPPWIKIHRRLLRDTEWVSLTDAQRGQLLAIWLLAADREGKVPDCPDSIKKLCFLRSKPDLELFIKLGFIDKRRQSDANMTPERRQHDAPEAKAEERREEKRQRREEGVQGEKGGAAFLSLPLNKNGEEYQVSEMQASEFEELFPAVDVRQELRQMKAWLIANPTRRKTRRGIARFINHWLSKEQDNPRTHKPKSRKERLAELERIGKGAT